MRYGIHSNVAAAQTTMHISDHWYLTIYTSTHHLYSQPYPTELAQVKA